MDLSGKNATSAISISASNGTALSLTDVFVSGLDKIEFLQNHENQDVYQKAFDMIERFFGSEEEDSRLAPQIDEAAQQFQFNSGDQPPAEGFQF